MGKISRVSDLPVRRFFKAFYDALDTLLKEDGLGDQDCKAPSCIALVAAKKAIPQEYRRPEA